LSPRWKGPSLTSSRHPERDILPTFFTEDLISLPTLSEYPEEPISGPSRSANEMISMSLIVQQKSSLGRNATQRTSHSIGIIGNSAEYCENWFDAIFHRKWRLYRPRAMIRPKACMQIKKVNGESLKKFKIKCHFIVTGHNQSLTSFSELLVKLGNSN
jgi:hypothetical protein